MEHKFKVGDKVSIIPGTTYYAQAPGLVGEVITPKSGTRVWVKWPEAGPWDYPPGHLNLVMKSQTNKEEAPMAKVKEYGSLAGSSGVVYVGTEGFRIRKNGDQLRLHIPIQFVRTRDEYVATDISLKELQVAVGMLLVKEQDEDPDE